MTAVAPLPNFQPVPRTGWSAPNGSANGINSMSADEVSRMFMPRPSAKRSNSSSSLASTASSSSTSTATSGPSNGAPTGGPDSNWGARKKPTRNVWPPTKSEPIAGLSNARPQSVATTSSGPSAASAISALHQPPSMLPSQHNVQSQTGQQNGLPRIQGQQDATAVLYLLPMNGTFDRKTITVPFFPDVIRIGRQTNVKTVPTPTNGYFDSKVLSRQHAEVWADKSGKIFIRDVKSSNGTFVNGQRLSQENRDSEPHELREQDVLELGIDIVSEDQKTVVHHKVAARVEHAGLYNTGSNVLDLNFGDLDNATTGGLMGAPMGQNVGGQVRGRTGNQSTIGNNTGRMSSAPPGTGPGQFNVLNQQRQLDYSWLRPITMEQIVKKLTAELVTAKKQQTELARTGQVVDKLLTEPKKEHRPIPQLKQSPIKDLKARFSDPPAPPPSQPLPEKPDHAQPLLKRNDTERPKLPTAQTSPPGRAENSIQINTLVDALSSAKRELESQNGKLKDLEDRLAQERQARESAEERAKHLETEQSHRMNGFLPSHPEEEVPEPKSPETPSQMAPVDAATHARLQQRLDEMLTEMQEMRIQMEKYRERAESAEAESKNDRQTLAEMVEKIRRDEAERAEREAERVRRDNSPTRELKSSSPALDGHISEDEQTSSIVSDDETPVEENQAKNKDLIKANPSSQLVETAPYASIIGVLVLGMGVMAYLNGWQKVDR
ncbi:hypothetical protein M501DRAFT_933617 [Patellaria atrata CBS 101060]|uniref:FHA domain-containing protein n=1 Tax=Patellaria atrata CBS 101060 TaxID=1346257 RepID=A0A9P4SAK0_9PEZI|nr:hypothetical protein M501DRAFT_933617 [Patellaria atrata CBS 101060]